MLARVPEKNKKPGVHYAPNSEGVELPIIDVTHPAFALAVTDEEQRRGRQKFVDESKKLARIPRPIRRWIFRALLGRSLLGRGIQNAEGTFLDALTTYLLKVGPSNLGDAYAKPIDRRIAESFPALTMRWRLQDMAGLLADELAPALAEIGRPIHFFDIAGGPAMDALNALLSVRRDHPDALTARRISITVLDGDARGPEFGARALAALTATGAPLAGLDISLEHVPYDWTKVDTLRTVLDRARAGGEWMIGSSEGGLFEYGSDQAIIDNLRVLREGTPSEFVMVGSVTRDDDAVRALRQNGSAEIRPRGLVVFSRLIARAGWTVRRAIGRPFSDHVVLGKTSS